MNKIYFFLLLLSPSFCISQDDSLDCRLIKQIKVGFVNLKSGPKVYVRQYTKIETLDSLELISRSRKTPRHILKYLISGAEHNSLSQGNICSFSDSIVNETELRWVHAHNDSIWHSDPTIEDSIIRHANALLRISNPKTRYRLYNAFMQTEYVTKHNEKIRQNSIRQVYFTRPSYNADYAYVKLYFFGETHSLIGGIREGEAFYVICRKTNGDNFVLVEVIRI